MHSVAGVVFRDAPSPTGWDPGVNFTGLRQDGAHLPSPAWPSIVLQRDQVTFPFFSALSPRINDVCWAAPPTRLPASCKPQRMEASRGRRVLCIAPRGAFDSVSATLAPRGWPWAHPHFLPQTCSRPFLQGRSGFSERETISSSKSGSEQFFF